MSIITVGLNPAIDRIVECANFHIGGHQTVTLRTRLAAGKAANVSRCLALLGMDSIASGFIGADELEFFQEQLLSIGPGRILSHFVEVSGRTRENVSVIDPVRRIETHLRERGFTVGAGECDLLLAKLAHDLRHDDMLVLAGSLCEGVEPEFLGRLADAADSHGAKVAVDTNGPPLALMARRRLFVLKPNLEEFKSIVGGNVGSTLSELTDAARRFLPAVTFVLISLGAEGAVLVTRDESWHARLANAGSPVRTVGCGDHLLAAFLDATVRGVGPEGALRQAVAVATARALSEDFAEFDLAGVKRLATAVEIER